MIKVNIIGSGNVASHLAEHLKNQVCGIFSRNIEEAKELANKLGVDFVRQIGDLPEVDMNIISVNDDSIESVASGLIKDIPVVHTSGSVGIEVFEGFKKYGILYPLQTFSKERSLRISDVPFLIEGNTTDFEAEIEMFCKSFLSINTQFADSELRSEIHLSAVISNNFITHLLFESERILKAKELSLDLLKPLIQETINKSFEIGPKLSQTGPAKRKDTSILINQLHKIESLKLKEVYRLMSDLIQEN